ncbi:MAG: aminopeptidase [Fluviicola sp.]|nr:MAG: aminopeptidase [Fluviicola sp.]
MSTRLKDWIVIFVCVVSVLGTSCKVTKPNDYIEESVSIDLLSQLKEIPQVKRITELETSDHFTQHVELWFEQLVDPQNPESETFEQRVLVAHSDNEAPVIVELQGYQIYSSKAGELASMFKGNQITIEHRFFANSKPEGEIPWEHLTLENAAMDQHNVITAIRSVLYPENKFLSTGISKGGQVTAIHRSMYPNDVDASVCYVAPLNFEREDKRIYHFLDTVGTEEQRSKIETFQILCFEMKTEILEELKAEQLENNYEWDMSLEKAFEYYVLEYPFAFWQWGGVSFEDIPDGEAGSDSILNHLLGVSGVSFFESSGVENLRPFFWSAMSEIGMYGYEYEPFEEYLSAKEDYTFEFTFPKGHAPVYSNVAMKRVNIFIQEKGTNMMFIYGGRDTWSATAVQLSDEAIKRGLKKYVNPVGHHGTRIRDFKNEQGSEIIGDLETWLEVKVTQD